MSNHITTWVLELKERVSAPFKRIKRWAGSAFTNVVKLDRRIDLLKGRVSSLGGTVRNLTLTAGAFGLLSVGSMEFESSMARANTMLQASKSELLDYTYKVQDLGVMSGVVKTELADGLYNTISASVPKENHISFLRDSVKASVGGTAELGEVVNATAIVVKAYGEAWSNAGRIQDKFQKTVQLGQINGLGELSTGLSLSASSAAKLGVTQSELLGVFATSNGVLGTSSELATKLNATLNAMIKPSSEAAKTAKQLGVAFNANVVRQSGGLINYINVLMPKIKAYSKATGIAQEQIIGSLFGSSEAIKLVMDLGGEFNQRWAKNTKDIQNSAGVVQTAFNAMMTTAKSDLGKLRNAVSNNIDGVLMSLAPLTSNIIQLITKVATWVHAFQKSNPVLTRVVTVVSAVSFGIVFLGTVTAYASAKLRLMSLLLIKASRNGNLLTRSIAKASRWVLGLGKRALTGAKRLGIMSASFALAALQGIGSFIIGLVSATAAQIGLNVAMTANPVGAVIVGLLAVGAAVYGLWQHWDKVKLFLLNFGKLFIKLNPFAWLIRLIDVVFPGFKQKIQEVFSSVIDWFKKMWDSIKGVWNSITDFFGFGDTSHEITVKDDPKDDKPKPPVISTGGGGSGGGGSGGSGSVSGLLSSSVGGVNGGSAGGGKTISIQLDVQNHFNMQAGNWKDNIDDIANVIVGKINDRLKDSLIIGS